LPAGSLIAEERGEPARVGDEVDGVARGRGVDDHHLEGSLRGGARHQVHRHQLVHAGRRVGEAEVEPVVEHARLGRGLVFEELLGEGVERAARVGHQRGEVAARGRERDARDLVGDGHAHGARQAPRRIDGDDQRGAAGTRQRQGQRGRGRRLAHAAAAGADHHEGRGARAHPAPSARSQRATSLAEGSTGASGTRQMP
jgi:hypothetical protein